MKIDEKTNFEHYKALGQAIINQCLKNDIEELRKRVERLEQKDNWVRL